MTSRRPVGGLAFGTAVAAAAVALAEHGPGGPGAWAVAVLRAAVMAAPLVLLGLALRASDPRTAWLTIALATALTAFVVLALVGDWSARTDPAHVLDVTVAVLVVATCVGTWRVETPLLGARSR